MKFNNLNNNSSGFAGTDEGFWFGHNHVRKFHPTVGWDNKHKNVYRAFLEWDTNNTVKIVLV